MHFTEASFLCSDYSAGDQKPVRHIIERLLAYVNRSLPSRCRALTVLTCICFANVQHVVYMSTSILFWLFSFALRSWISAFPYASHWAAYTHTTYGYHTHTFWRVTFWLHVLSVTVIPTCSWIIESLLCMLISCDYVSQPSRTQISRASAELLCKHSLFLDTCTQPYMLAMLSQQLVRGANTNKHALVK